jgi:hypothetical protein
VVTIRPERIRLMQNGEQPSEGACVVTGKVRESLYAGPSTRFVVDLAGGGQLMVVRQNVEQSFAESEALVGRTVRLTWAKNHTRLIGTTGAPEELGEVVAATQIEFFLSGAPILTEAGASSAIVDMPHGGMGIVTDRDLRTRVVAAGVPGSAPVQVVKTTHVVTRLVERVERVGELDPTLGPSAQQEVFAPATRRS